MTNPINNAISAARGAQKSLAGVALVLSRSGAAGDTDIALATVGETRVEDFFEDGSVVSVRVRDFLIDAADYLIDGVEVPPTVGDLITQEINGRSVVFQVLPAGAEREYRRSDREGTFWRVHTKEQSGNELG